MKNSIIDYIEVVCKFNNIDYEKKEPNMIIINNDCIDIFIDDKYIAIDYTVFGETIERFYCLEYIGEQTIKELLNERIIFELNSDYMSLEDLYDKFNNYIDSLPEYQRKKIKLKSYNCDDFILGLRFEIYEKNKRLYSLFFNIKCYMKINNIFNGIDKILKINNEEEHFVNKDDVFNFF
jgi:hypothetical protein